MQRPFPIILLFCFSLLSCSDKSVTLNPLSENASILAFGDSLTFGTGVEKTQSYPSILNQLTQRIVINAGIPGELSETGVRRLEVLLDQHQPKLLILMHGGNDLIRKKSIDQLKNNLNQMISMAKQRQIDVILIAVPSPSLLLNSHPLYDEVAQQQNIPIENSALADILQYPSNKSDTIHPNAKGYQLLAEQIQQLLEESGAL